MNSNSRIYIDPTKSLFGLLLLNQEIKQRREENTRRVLVEKTKKPVLTSIVMLADLENK